MTRMSSEKNIFGMDMKNINAVSRGVENPNFNQVNGFCEVSIQSGNRKIAVNPRTWRDADVRMSNIFELESQCKLLLDEKQQLEAMLVKLRQEYEIETKYLKNQVENERERQTQWKELYFKTHAELADLKRRFHVYHSPLRPSTSDVDQRWVRRDRKESDSQDVQEKSGSIAIHTESERKVRSSPFFGHPLSIEQIQRPSSSSIVMPHIPQHREEDQRTKPHLLRPFAQSTLPSQVFKPEPIHSSQLHERAPAKLPERLQLQQPYYRCPICKIYYDTEQKLNFHMELHKDRYQDSKLPSMAPIHLTQRPFQDPYQTTNPSPDDYLVCSECNQGFNIEDEYRRHVLVHLFKCRFCGVNIDNENNFFAHIKGHNLSNEQRQSPFTCFICGKQFTHAQYLTAHLLSHPEEKNFTCNECGKTFSRKGHLTRHMSIHTAYRPYTCKDCGKAFAHKTHLRRHEIVHSGARPYKCKLCEQAFSRKSSLSRHYFIHTTERPFVCPVCEKGFNRKGRLRNHLKIHIREGYPELANYVIERRPITKEFIERMNNVASPPTVSHSSTAEINQRLEDETKDVEGIVNEERIIKEESDESSSSESEGEEGEGELSEEISYGESEKSNAEPNNNTIQSTSQNHLSLEKTETSAPIDEENESPTMSHM